MSDFIIIFLSISAVLTSLAFIGFFALRRRRRRMAGTQTRHGTLLIDGDTLVEISGCAEAVVHEIAQCTDAFAPLREQLTVLEPELTQKLDQLLVAGQPFSHVVRLASGAVMLRGQPEGALARIEITPASADAEALDLAQSEIAHLQDECTLLRNIIRLAPLAIRHYPGAEEDPLWLNKQDSPALALTMDAARIDDKPAARLSINDEKGKPEHWFQAHRHVHDDGQETVFAIGIDALVQTETTLKSFVATLTETFAHLTTGLAVFDGDGRLTLFNPALCDLFSLEPGLLAARPRLSDFLETLREKRMIPEQRDFASWRRKIIRLEEGARAGTYRADWLLPSGRIIRVIGRPHPLGAMAFLFEDISSVVMLERRYRAEIELSQAAMDKMTNGVAVFDPSGAPVFANRAFDAMWQTETLATVEAPNIREMTRHWQALCGPSPLWGDIRSFVTGEESRTSWTVEIRTLDNRHMNTLLAPLPDGSTLIVFNDVTDEEETLERLQSLVGSLQSAQEAHHAILEIALDNLAEPVQTAIQHLERQTKKGAPDPSDEPRAIAALLGHALQRTKTLHALAAKSQPSTEHFGGIEAYLSLRNITLDTSGWTPPAERFLDGNQLRRVLWNVILLASDHAPAGCTIAAEMELENEQVTIRATLGPGATTSEIVPATVSSRLLDRVLTQLGGRCEITSDADAGQLTFHCHLPRTGAAATTKAVRERDHA